MKKLTAAILGSLMVFNLSACGTILYPERKGQTDGQLDPAVVILDAVGLLFFFVPGVIAFAVDFSNGTIYLPGGSASVLDDEQMGNIVQNGQVDMEALEALVEERSGSDVELDSESLDVSYLPSADELPAAFAATGMAPASLALLR